MSCSGGCSGQALGAGRRRGGRGEEGWGGRAVVTGIRAQRLRLVSVHRAHMASSRVRLWGGMAPPGPQLWISGSCHRGGTGLAPKCVDSAMIATQGCLGRRVGVGADGRRQLLQPLQRHCLGSRPRDRRPEVSLLPAGPYESVGG